MQKISLQLLVSLMIVAFILGISIGYFVSPSYQQTMYAKEEMGFGVADRFVDLRYIDKMISHHRGAVLLAQQAEKKSDRVEIIKLSKDIQKNEPVLIDELNGWKKDWYKDNRKVKDPVVSNLGPSDENIDLRFLNSLIFHHQEGIIMTKEIRTKSSRKEILDNADSVENFLTNSLTLLKSFREQWFNVK